MPRRQVFHALGRESGFARQGVRVGDVTRSIKVNAAGPAHRVTCVQASEPNVIRVVWPWEKLFSEASS